MWEGEIVVIKSEGGRVGRESGRRKKEWRMKEESGNYEEERGGRLFKRERERER